MPGSGSCASANAAAISAAENVPGAAATRERSVRQPSRRDAQPFSAMSLSTAASVRTGTPVPPFIV